MLCCVNGKFQPFEEATVGIQDLAVIRGYGIFDFFRLSEGVPLFIEDHLDRFYRGAERVKLKINYSRDELRSQIEELIRTNQMPVSGIRLVLTGGVGGGTYQVGTPNLIITQEPIAFPPAELYITGAKLISYEYLRDIPEVKTINYMTGIWLQQQVQQEEAFDVLYTNDGKVHELTRSNIFIINDAGTLVTPADQILEGVTRKKILKAVGQHQKVEQRAISLDEFRNAREAFLTGTTKKVLPIRQIDDQVIGEPGPFTLGIMDRFRQIEEQFVRHHSSSGLLK